MKVRNSYGVILNVKNPKKKLLWQMLADNADKGGYCPYRVEVLEE